LLASSSRSSTSPTTTTLSTLSLHDALPIYTLTVAGGAFDLTTFNNTINTVVVSGGSVVGTTGVLTSNTFDLRSGTASGILAGTKDRKSTRLNSSHLVISYAVFCLKKKKQQK